MTAEWIDGGSARQRGAEFACSLMKWAASYPRVDADDVVARSAIIVADDISAIVAAFAEPSVQRMHASAWSGSGEATVFSRSVLPRTSAARAAEANGLAVTWCELDEGARAVPCHAGAYTLPVLMAEAERIELTTGDLLARLAIAYEVVVRVAKAFPFQTLRVHPHAAYAALGAAVAASLARGHDGEQLMRSASAGISMAFAGPYGHAVDGAMVRHAWTSAGARNGLMCADLAEAGVGGIPESFYDSLVTSLGAVPGELEIHDLGQRWAVSDGYHKVYACCQYAHSAIEASMEMHAQLKARGSGPGAISSILIETHPRGETLTTMTPTTSLAAKFSIPHAAAAVAVLGEGGRAAFDEASLDEPEIARLRSLVEIRPHPAIGAWPNDRPARVTWRLADGSQMVGECASAVGGADRPFAPAALAAKFQDLTRDAYPGMADVFKAMIDRDGRTLGEPWRESVDRMTGR
jgi:2-methylcitrate dehydratase PrpD